MKKELRFAFYAIKKNIQNSAELRASFLMNIFGMVLNNTAFIIGWVFFVKSVGIINGWTAADIIGLLGFGTISFGLMFSIGAGFRKISDQIANGTFDRFILSPKNLILRIATSSFDASAVGDVVFGATCLIFYGIILQATISQILLMVFLIFISIIIFVSVVLAINSIGFFFTDPTDVVSSIFEIFLTPSMFHGGAFQGGMRFVFTFLVPSLLIGTLPVEIVRDLSFWKLGLICLLAFLWFCFSIKLFYRCLRKYESSSFMTFGQ